MKFALSIATLFAATNAMKVMSESEISALSFEEQLNLIQAVQTNAETLTTSIE